jgi:hypothetical protein
MSPAMREERPGHVGNDTQLALRLFVDGAKPASAAKVALQWKVSDPRRHRPYSALSGKRWVVLRWNKKSVEKYCSIWPAPRRDTQE